MLEPYCYGDQIPDCYRLAASNRRAFHIEVVVDFVGLPVPPGATSLDRWEVSREESYEFSFPADQLSRDAAGERNVRYMLTEAGVMYTPQHEFMVQTVLSRAASIAGDERNREAEVLPMWVYIWCADPCIHGEQVMSEEDEDEDEGLATSSDEGEDMDTSEDNDEEELAMIGQWLAGLTEVEVTERSVDCVICCEEITAGSTASSMPCCHVYHLGCIAKWLKNSRTCPLCRLELPSTYFY